MVNIYGGSGDNTLSGTASDDSIRGGAGNDTIAGDGGADTINAGYDDDSVDGGAGADQIDGNLGDDSITGGAGDDADTITGGAGNDTIDGQGGDDLIDGGTGAGDSIPGGHNDDDLIFGSAGNDTITGNDGNDTIDGGVGNDSLAGDDGNDTLAGGEGDDLLTGGQGDDTFVYTAGDGADTITDFLDQTGAIDDGDPTNNNLVDLSAFFNILKLAAVNNADADPTNDFIHALDMLRADAADGTIDGVIGGTDYGAIIGDIDLTILDGGAAVDPTNLTFENTNVPCFVAGTMIATDKGDRPIETLAEGDLVMTRDHGLQPIRWIGSRAVVATGDLAPIEIAAGTFGNRQALRVSPQHRILIAGWQAELLFGEEEVLVPAKALVNDRTIRRLAIPTVTYCHMLFDQHEVVLSQGMWTESLHTGKEALDSLGEHSRQEILRIFPELGLTQDPLGALARTTIPVREAMALAAYL